MLLYVLLFGHSLGRFGAHNAKQIVNRQNKRRKESSEASGLIWPKHKEQ